MDLILTPQSGRQQIRRKLNIHYARDSADEWSHVAKANNPRKREAFFKGIAKKYGETEALPLRVDGKRVPRFDEVMRLSYEPLYVTSFPSYAGNSTRTINMTGSLPPLHEIRAYDVIFEFSIISGVVGAGAVV